MTDAQRHSQPNDHCRAALVGVQATATTHAGLWFDKFFTALEESATPQDDQRKWELAEVVAALPVPEEYAAWYERWKTALATQTLLAQTEDYDVVQQPFGVRGRMVIGLGADAPLENSITLHRTYGVPYIPGSALKGLAAGYAYNRLAPGDWRADPGSKPDRKGNHSEFYRTLFGTTDEAGFVTFFDALYIPGSAEADRPLRLDVLTVHHQDYYQGNAPPADWDSPIPVPFLSAVGSYLVALAGPKLWLGVTLNLLTLALLDAGIGAKTSSGYGRMEITAPKAFARRPFAPPNRRQQLAAHSDRPQRARQPDRPASPAGPARVYGMITYYNSAGEYGFIMRDGSDEQFYFRRSRLRPGVEPRRGLRISIGETKPGRSGGKPEAFDIRLEPE